MRKHTLELDVLIAKLNELEYDDYQRVYLLPRWLQEEALRHLGDLVSSTAAKRSET